MKSLLWVLVALPAITFGQSEAGGFVVKGNVKGLPENSIVFLSAVSSPTDTAAQAIVKQGQFELKGHAAEPNLFQLNFGTADRKVPLFMGNDNVTLTGSSDDLKAIVVKGSSTNDDFVYFQQTFNPIFARLNNVIATANATTKTSTKDSLFQVYKNTVDTVQHKVDQFVVDKKSSFVTGFVLVVLNQLTDDVMLQEKRLNLLSADVQKGYYASMLRKQIDEGKIGAVGTDAIDFTQNDTAGHAVSLSSFKGKYVLVDFWASWCGPCRQENPNVLSNYKKFKDKNFTVLGVSLDKAKEPWLKAIKDDGLPWTQVSDLKFWYNDAAVKYHVQSIPQNLLIDPNGKIIGKNLRGPDLQAKLCELLGCN